MNPFRITCTTCHARIKIVDPSAIGDIIACPKCSSMVQATPPEGWSPDGPATTDSIVLGSSAMAAAVAASAGSKAKAASPSKVAVGRAVPPPLPKVSPAATATSASSTNAISASPSDVGLDLTTIAAPSARWFLPALTAATVMSLGIAALVIHLNHKDQPDPVVASAAATSATAPLPAPATAAQPKPNEANQAAKNDETPAKPAAPQKAVAADVPAAKPEPKTESATKPSADPPPSKVTASDPKPMVEVVPPQPHLADSPPVPMTEPAAAPPAVADAPPLAPAVIAAPEKPDADPALGDAPGKPPARPSVERIPPRTVDVEAHLTDPLAAVNFRDTPLVQLLGELSQWSTIPISLDADALNELNISPEAPVTVRLKESTVGSVLDEALSPLGLTYYTVGHQLVIGRPKQGELRPVRYSVPDLSGDSPASKAQFESLVHAMVEPSGWKEAGGSATSHWGDGGLIIEAGESARTQMLVFCEKLRVARGLPLRSKIDPARFSLTPHFAAAKAALAVPVTVNYGRPEPLGRVVSYLQSVAKVTLLVDQAALADQRTSIDTQGILLADQQPLGQALTALVEPMELTWRVVGERTIEITTPQAAARRAEVEFYPAAELLTGTSGEALVARVERELAASAGGEQPAAKAAIRFDLPSRTLIVRAPQSVQGRVAALLSGWRLARQ